MDTLSTRAYSLNEDEGKDWWKSIKRGKLIGSAAVTSRCALFFRILFRFSELEGGRYSAEVNFLKSFEIFPSGRDEEELWLRPSHELEPTEAFSDKRERWWHSRD